MLYTDRLSPDIKITNFLEKKKMAQAYGFLVHTVKWNDCLSRFWLLKQSNTDQVALNIISLFLTVLKPGSLRSGYQHAWGLVRTFFWFADGWLIASSHSRQQREEASTNPIRGGSTPITSSNHNRLPKAPLPNLIAQGIGFQHTNFGGHKHSVYNNDCLTSRQCDLPRGRR